MDETSKTKRNGVFLLCASPSWVMNIWPLAAKAFQTGHVDTEIGAMVVLLTVSVATMTVVPLAMVKARRFPVAILILLFGLVPFSINWHNALNVASHAQDKLNSEGEGAIKQSKLLNEDIIKWQAEAAKIPANHIQESEETFRVAEDAAKAATATKEAECKWLGSRCRLAEDAERTALTHRAQVAEAFRLTKLEEKLDKDIHSAQEKLATLAVPGKADPAAARLAAMLPIDEKWLHENWPTWVSFGIEVLAMFGPIVWLFGLAAPASARRREVEPEEKPVPDIRYDAPEAAPVPSIALPAVPQVEPYAEQVGAMEPDAAPVVQVASEAPASASRRRAGIMTELVFEELPEAPPPSGRKRTKQRSPTTEARGDNVIPFAKRATQGEVLALVASGKTQKEIAALFGCTDRTIRNILSGNRKAESAVSLQA